MRVIVITNLVPNKISSFFKFEDNDYIIAVDGALDSCIKQKISPNLVVGDMDSLTNLNALKKFEKIILKKEKDETDTLVAIKEAYKLSNNVIMIGGIEGSRIEHFIANLTLFNEFPNLTILNENSKIYLLNKGRHIITKVNNASFFAYSNLVISLKGFKYNLDKYNIKMFDPIGVSNSVTEVYGEVIIHEGSALTILTK